MSVNRLVWSNLAAQTAEQISLAAAPIFAVLYLGAGVGETGFLNFAQTLPFLLFAIPAGILADRFSRVRVMVWAEAVRVCALLAVLALAMAGVLTWPLLALTGFVAAGATVAFSVAAPALVPGLVGATARGAANARIELARTLAFTAGPAAGGLLVGWSGAIAAFGCAALLSLVAAMLLAGLAEPKRVAPTSSRHWRSEAQAGARFVFGHAMLRPVFVTQFFYGVAFFVLYTAFVPYAAGRLGLAAAGVGLVLGVYGAGMICGALAVAALLRRLSLGVVIGIGPVTGFVASLIMLMTLGLAQAWLAAASFFLIGFGGIVWVVSTTTLRQAVTPPDLLGRVSAVNILAYGSRPIGAALGALAGSAFGVEVCLVVAAAAFLWQAIVILVSPVVRLKSQAALAG